MESVVKCYIANSYLALSKNDKVFNFRFCVSVTCCSTSSVNCDVKIQTINHIKSVVCFKYIKNK